jgi:hypothetical protein
MIQRYYVPVIPIDVGWEDMEAGEAAFILLLLAFIALTIFVIAHFIDNAERNRYLQWMAEEERRAREEEEQAEAAALEWMRKMERKILLMAMDTCFEIYNLPEQREIELRRFIAEEKITTYRELMVACEETKSSSAPPSEDTSPLQNP